MDVERTIEGQKRTDAKMGELAVEMKELAKAQKNTERMFQAFIKGQRKRIAHALMPSNQA